MLEPEVVTRIRETVGAELGPRGEKVRAELQAIQRQLAARGLSRSGNELHERARIACDELAIRAALIWEIVQRCHTTFGSRDNPQLLADLQQQVHEHVTLHANMLGGIVNPGPRPDWPRDPGTIVREQIDTRRDQLIAKYKNDAHFYVRARTQAQAPASGSVTVHGNVHSIQTGAYSIANVHIEAAVAPRFVGALSALTEAIQGARDMGVDERAQSMEIASNLQTAAKAAKPNGPLLLGLLRGLSTTVQTVASIKPMWDAVKDAAAALGIPTHSDASIGTHSSVRGKNATLTTLDRVQ